MAVFVTVNCVKAKTVRVEMTGNVGAIFTSLTMTVKVFVEVRAGFTKSYGLLLVATVVIKFVLGLWVWAGVQVMTPLALMTMLFGGLTRR